MSISSNGKLVKIVNLNQLEYIAIGTNIQLFFVIFSHVKVFEDSGFVLFVELLHEINKLFMRPPKKVKLKPKGSQSYAQKPIVKGGVRSFNMPPVVCLSLLSRDEALRWRVDVSMYPSRHVVRRR